MNIELPQIQPDTASACLWAKFVITFSYFTKFQAVHFNGES